MMKEETKNLLIKNALTCVRATENFIDFYEYYYADEVEMFDAEAKAEWNVMKKSVRTINTLFIDEAKECV